MPVALKWRTESAHALYPTHSWRRRPDAFTNAEVSTRREARRPRWDKNRVVAGSDAGTTTMKQSFETRRCGATTPGVVVLRGQRSVAANTRCR